MTTFSRSRSQSRSRFHPHLESLEGRLLLNCDVPEPPPTCKYLSADGNDENNDGSFNAPWQTIDRLNTAIAAGQILPGYTIHFHRGHTFAGHLLFDGVGGTPGQPITLTRYGTQGSSTHALIDAGAETGITVRNAGHFVISWLKIIGSYDPQSLIPTSEGNGLEILSDLGPVAPVYENILLHNLDISGFGGYMYTGETGPARRPTTTTPGTASSSMPCSRMSLRGPGGTMLASRFTARNCLGMRWPGSSSTTRTASIAMLPGAPT